MQWQDVVLSSGFVLFSVALVPSVLGKDKPALATSILTAFVLAVDTIVFATLSLWVSAAGSFLNFVLWSILGVQKGAEIRRRSVARQAGEFPARL